MEHMKYQFGSLLYNLRKERDKVEKVRVPEICKLLGCAPSLWYRWEKGEEVTVNNKFLSEIASFFGLKESDENWFKLMTFPYLSRETFPPYMKNTHVYKRYMHLLFFKLADINPTKEEFTEAMQTIVDARKHATV